MSVVLYDECADLGLQLPVLTFPEQNPNRTLSSVVLPTGPTPTVLRSIPFTQPFLAFLILLPPLRFRVRLPLPLILLLRPRPQYLLESDLWRHVTSI